MVKRCVLGGCSNPKESNVSVHTFPSDPELKTKWDQFVCLTRSDWKGGKIGVSVICGAHFVAPDDFISYDQWRAGFRRKLVLVKGAVPSILPPGLFDSTPKRGRQKPRWASSSLSLNSALTSGRNATVAFKPNTSGAKRSDNVNNNNNKQFNVAMAEAAAIAAAANLDAIETKTKSKPLKSTIQTQRTIELIESSKTASSSLAGPSNQGYTGKPETSRRKKIATATVSSETVLIPDDSPPQPTAPKLQKKQIDDRRFDERRFEEQQRFQERRFENRRFDERRQQMAAAVQSAQVAAPSLQIPPQMQVKQHLQVAPPPPPPLQAPRQVQVLAPPPVQVPVPKPKPVEKPRPREKRIFVVADHQRCVMSNLASLWKSGKLCDAGIGNGSSTVMVHKVVLSAVCPKLLSVFSTDILSHKFLQVNFPEEVSTEALNAFAEYMYNGILDLDPDILQQLKIIAKRLDMKEFEQLCDSHLPNQHHQPVAAAATSSISFNNLPLIQTSVPIIPSIPTSHQTSLSSLNISTLPSVPSITTQVIDVKQEISEAELDQVKKDTAAVFGEESQVVSLAPNQSGNAGFVISPSIKTEPIGPEDDKYGRLGVVGKTNSSNNQVYTSSSSSISAVPSSSISSLSTAAFVAPSSSSSLTSSSILSSIPTSSTEYAIPFTDTIDIKTTELKLTPTTASTTYVTPSLMPDLSSVTSIVEAVCSQPSAMNEEDSTKPLTQQQPSLSAMSSSSSALEGPSLSSSGHDNIYPVGLFTAEGDNLPLLTTQTVGIKTIDLYKTDLT